MLGLGPFEMAGLLESGETLGATAEGCTVPLQVDKLVVTLVFVLIEDPQVEFAVAFEEPLVAEFTSDNVLRAATLGKESIGAQRAVDVFAADT